MKVAKSFCSCSCLCSFRPSSAVDGVYAIQKKEKEEKKKRGKQRGRGRKQEEKVENRE